MTNFIAAGGAGTELLLTAAAAGVALIGGVLTMPLLRRATFATRADLRNLWVGLAAVVCGSAMLIAVVLPLLGVAAGPTVAYDLRQIGSALLVAIVMAGFGLAVAVPQSDEEPQPILAALGGGVLGAGVAATHYVASTAIRFPGRVHWDMSIGLASGALGIALGAGALYLAARAQTSLARLCGTALLAAALFVPQEIALTGVDAVMHQRIATPVGSSQILVLIGLAVLMLVSLALTTAVAFLDGRLSDRNGAESSRLQAFADLTGEGILICEDGRIVDVNVAAARLLGLDPAVVRGRALRDFVDAPDPDRLLSASLAKPQEAPLRATGGEPRWVEIGSRDVRIHGRSRRVFTLRDLSELRRSEHRIRHLAYHDTLTGLANRAAFNDALAAALMRRNGEVALFCIDLDRFKEINDVYGHAAGDEMLRIAARRIVAAAPDAMVFRLGGDEFVAIGTGPDAGDADKLALRLTERLNVETVVAGQTLRLGASVGFAVYPQHGANVDALFANADAALYRAKADGRGLARGFEPDMDLALRERRALQADLATALARNEMFLHWMPQANTESGEIVGFEALVRWKHPTRGVVPPAIFIPVAEETAAIVHIGEWVLRTACYEAARWIRPVKVAVNLSPIQFQHGDLPALVHQILIETGLPASRLELEITEGVLLHDLPGALQTLRRLKALGAQIAMDDFGTGYSSLSYLQAFPFDRIKIDASFIRTLATSPQAKAIVRAVVALGASLDMPITAEGVETPEQRAFLAELHCEEIQGYLVGRPSPLISFESPFAKTRMRAVG